MGDGQRRALSIEEMNCEGLVLTERGMKGPHNAEISGFPVARAPGNLSGGDEINLRNVPYVKHWLCFFGVCGIISACIRRTEVCENERCAPEEEDSRVHEIPQVVSSDFHGKPSRGFHIYTSPLQPSMPGSAGFHLSSSPSPL